MRNFCTFWCFSISNFKAELIEQTKLFVALSSFHPSSRCSVKMSAKDRAYSHSKELNCSNLCGKKKVNHFKMLTNYVVFPSTKCFFNLFFSECTLIYSIRAQRDDFCCQHMLNCSNNVSDLLDWQTNAFGVRVHLHIRIAYNSWVCNVYNDFYRHSRITYSNELWS